MKFFTTLWWLLGVHALTDYVLQPPDMAQRKNPAHPGDSTYGPWWWWMSAHALINGLGVTYVTQQPLLGVGEAIIHFVTDTLKCKGLLSTNTDQLSHLLSKVVWAVI